MKVRSTAVNEAFSHARKTKERQKGQRLYSADYLDKHIGEVREPPCIRAFARDSAISSPSAYTETRERECAHSAKCTRARVGEICIETKKHGARARAPNTCFLVQLTSISRASIGAERTYSCCLYTRIG